MPRAAPKKRARADSSTATAPRKTRRAPPVSDEPELEERDVEELIGSGVM